MFVDLALKIFRGKISGGGSSMVFLTKRLEERLGGKLNAVEQNLNVPNSLRSRPVANPADNYLWYAHSAIMTRMLYYNVD